MKNVVKARKGNSRTKLAAAAAAALLVCVGFTAQADEVVKPAETGGGSGSSEPYSPPSGGMSEAEQLSCTVALCMANPNGANALQECRKPIEDWAERKRRGKSTPPCPGFDDGEGGGKSGSGGGRDDGPGGRKQQN